MNKIYLNGGKDYLFWREGSGNTVEIFDIVVSTERRHGIGRKMVNILLTKIPPTTKMVYAITRSNNRVAHLFYEEMKFRIVANLFDFYQDGEVESKNGRGCVDAIMYGRDIESKV